MIRAELERRPLLILSLGLILGLTLVLHPIHALFVLPAPWILRPLTPRTILVLGIVAGVLLGPGPDPPLIESQFVTGDWDVRTMPVIGPGSQMCDVQQGQVRLALFYTGPIQLCPGSTINFRGVAKPPKEGNETYYSQRAYLGRVAVTNNSLRVVREAPFIQRIACGWRAKFLELSSVNLPPKDAVLEDSICFHVDKLLDQSTADQVKQAGVVHLIAASGLQALLIGQTLLWLLAWLPIPRWSQLLILGSVLALYAIATGSSPSIIRAVIMSLIANSAYLFRREPDWISALAATSILYLLWFPNGVYEIGFQLSFIAVLFLSMFRRNVKWRPGFKAWIIRWAVSSLRGAVIAYVVLTPLIAHFFGIVSMAMVPAGLLTMIAAIPLVIVSMLALPLSLVLPSIGAMAIKATEPLADFIRLVLTSFGGKGAVLETPPFSPYWLVPFYVLLLLLWRPMVRRP